MWAGGRPGLWTHTARPADLSLFSSTSMGWLQQPATPDAEHPVLASVLQGLLHSRACTPCPDTLGHL